MAVVLAYLRCLSFPYRSPSLFSLLHRITPGFFRTSWSSSLALQGKPMVLFGSTMKQWQLALSLSVGPGARVFVAECDPFCDIEFCVSVCASRHWRLVPRGVSLQFESKLIFISRSANGMSQRECGHTGHVLLPWCQRFFQEVIQVFVDLKRAFVIFPQL